MNFAALSLGTLLVGRLMVIESCIGLLTNAITIAIRYSAVRKQFGPTDNEELSVIEYPLQVKLVKLLLYKSLNQIILPLGINQKLS